MRSTQKQAFDAMREALQYCKDNAGVPGLVWERARAALAVADAVAEQGHGPQPMPDLTTLITNGAKAWAGVNAQDLREGKPVGEPPADQFPDAGKMAAALRAIADGTVTGGQSQSHLATVLAYQTLARKTLETDAERMAGARAKWDDTYQGDLLARMEDDPR